MLLTDLIRELREIVDSAIATGTVEGHLAALVLSGEGRSSEAASKALVDGPWREAVRRLVEAVDDHRPMASTRDVALAGVQIALGARVRTEFVSAARRELARAPMPPAATVADDERLLLGIAAGVGHAAPELASAVSQLTSARRSGASLRRACLDVWAEALAAGSPRLNEETARSAFSILRTTSDAQPAMAAEDWPIALWMASSLFAAPWNPRDDDRSILDQILRGAYRATMASLPPSDRIGALDAALTLDALTSVPTYRPASGSDLEQVLTIIDSFAASAATLANRQRGRQPFEIRDEYDVQDLFRALLLPVLPDLQPEDPAPKIAGRSTRLDFTSKRTRLGFEIKHIAKSSRVKAVREEVLLDERTYAAHPYLETVLVFIYDPQCHLRLDDRPAFEADLSTTVSVDGRSIRYITRVR